MVPGTRSAHFLSRGTSVVDSSLKTFLLFWLLQTPTSLQWYLEVYPQLPPEARPLEVLQCPGDTMFVPAGAILFVILVGHLALVRMLQEKLRVCCSAPGTPCLCRQVGT